MSTLNRGYRVFENTHVIKAWNMLMDKTTLTKSWLKFPSGSDGLFWGIYILGATVISIIIPPLFPAWLFLLAFWYFLGLNLV